VRKRFNSPGLPYNELPLLPPVQDLETKSILKVAIEAHTALSELRSAAKSIPDESVLVRAIALQEARISSEIEMVVTTNDELYQAMSSDGEGAADPKTKEVLRYAEAVWTGYRHLADGGRLDSDLFCSLASTILKQDAGIRTGAGTRVGDSRSGRVVYTPPMGMQLIRNLLDNLAAYMNEAEEVEPLVRLAVSHYQFEAIHPFHDANGRVGRVVNILFLVQQQLLNKPILYLSRPVLEDRRAYYNGLRRVTEFGEWEPWVLYMLENVWLTAVETRRRIDAIAQEIERANELARASMKRGYSRALIEVVFSQPYSRIAFLERAGIAKRQTASEYLQELERVGILRGEKRGREMIYLNESLLRILSL
jgi:Fic family protein